MQQVFLFQTAQQIGFEIGFDSQLQIGFDFQLVVGSDFHLELGFDFHLVVQVQQLVVVRHISYCCDHMLHTYDTRWLCVTSLFW